MKRKIIATLSLFSLLGLVLPVAAQVEPPAPVTTIEGLIGVIDTAATWLMGILLAIGVIMLLLAGFTWMTAAGDEEKTGKARKMLIWGLVGIAIGLVAKGLISLVAQLVGTTV